MNINRVVEFDEFPSLVFWLSYNPSKGGTSPLKGREKEFASLNREWEEVFEKLTKEDKEKLVLLFGGEKLPIPVFRNNAGRRWVDIRFILQKNDSTLHFIEGGTIQDVVKNYLDEWNRIEETKKTFRSKFIELRDPETTKRIEILIKNKKIVREWNESNWIRLTSTKEKLSRIKELLQILGNTSVNSKLKEYLECQHEALSIVPVNQYFDVKCSQCGFERTLSDGEKPLSITIPNVREEDILFIEEMKKENVEVEDDHPLIANTKKLFNAFIHLKDISSLIEKINEELEISKATILYKCEDKKLIGEEVRNLLHFYKILSKRSFKDRTVYKNAKDWFDSLDIQGIETYIQKEVPIVEMVANNLPKVKKLLEKAIEKMDEESKRIAENIPSRFQLNKMPFSKEQVKDLLTFVDKLDGGFGITTYSEVLAGSNSQKIRGFSLDKNPFHGYLSHLKRPQVLGVLEDIEDNGWAYRKGRDYPKFVLTEKGKKLLILLSRCDPIVNEQQREEFMKLSLREFHLQIKDRQSPEEWKEEYMNRFFEKEEVKSYRIILDKVKRETDEEISTFYYRFLERYYNEAYYPVLSFILESKKKTKFGSLLSNLLKEKEKKSC